MNTMQIDITAGRTAFEPGDEIDLTLSWNLAEAPESVELRLVWSTAGKGTTDLEVVQTMPFEFPSPMETRRTSITLPASPYSFSGKLITLQWALELIAFPSEESTRQEIIMAPTGAEVRLRPVEKATLAE